MHFKLILEEQRKDDLNKAIVRGNYKLVLTRPDLLEELAQDKIEAGF